MDQIDYMSLFLEEGRERLHEISELLAALETRPGDAELLNDVFRSVHTFKGMADTMEYSDLALLTHDMESVLDGLRAGALLLTPETAHLLQRCLAVLEARIADIAEQRPGEVDHAVLLTELEALMAQAKAKRPATEAVAAVEVPTEERTYARSLRVGVTLDSSCFLKGMRALMITTSLETIGTIADMAPTADELEWDPMAEGFALTLATDASIEDVSAMVRSIGDVVGAEVTELSQAAQAPEPEPEPLVAGGTPLSEDELLRVAAAERAGHQALWIEVALMVGSRMKGVRASLVGHLLAAFGTVVRVEPEPAVLEEEGGSDGFRLLFLSGEAPTSLRESLMNVAEVVTVAIAPYDGMRPALIAPASAPENPTEREVIVPATTRPRRTRTVRVDSEQLDELVDRASELMSQHAQLVRLAERQGGELEGAMREAAVLTAGLRDALMALRLVSVETVFNRFPRMVRDLARELGKQVRLEASGQDVSLDRLLADELGDLIVHLLRNSLDHGLETPGERHGAGKESEGTIALAARLEAGQVLITLTDDGRGIDVDRVVAAEVARGRLSPKSAAKLSRDEGLMLIFSPGLSTMAKATRLSGRGVGLDAVKNKIDGLGGTIRVLTTPGLGTTFELRFPMGREARVPTAEPAEI